MTDRELSSEQRLIGLYSMWHGLPSGFGLSLFHFLGAPVYFACELKKTVEWNRGDVMIHEYMHDFLEGEIEPGYWWVDFEGQIQKTDYLRYEVEILKVHSVSYAGAWPALCIGL